jgi:transcriptional regulator with XRE-family HTH domain
MELGPKLKAIRTTQGVTLQQMADRTRLSKSFVSQVESGAANPSIASLKRIADALGITLGELFESSPNGNGLATVAAKEPRLPERKHRTQPRVVRKDRRKMLVFPGQTCTTYLLTPDLQRNLEVILSHIDPGHTTGEDGYTHVGEEFGLVLKGRVEVTVDSEVFVLEPGDSVSYSSEVPHSIRLLGDEPGETLWVITPPSY